MWLLAVLRFHAQEPKEIKRFCASCAARPPARAVTHIALVRLRSQSRRSGSCSPSNRPDREDPPSVSSSQEMGLGKIRENRSLHAPTRANIPTSSYGSRRFSSKWNTRNWLREAGISRSDAPQYRPRRKLTGKWLSL